MDETTKKKRIEMLQAEAAVAWLRERGHVAVLRVPDDRGSVAVTGAHPPEKAYLDGDPCFDCGRVGHVAYLGGYWEAWTPKAEAKRGRKRHAHASKGDGESVYECAWCGMTMTTRDIHKNFDKDHAEWKKEQEHYGYEVRHSSNPPKGADTGDLTPEEGRRLQRRTLRRLRAARTRGARR